MATVRASLKSSAFQSLTTHSWVVGNKPDRQKLVNDVYERYICTYNKRCVMDTKLTLRLNDQVIERAKEYARNHKVSLSKMIESYLDSVTKQNELEDKDTVTPLVESLSGVIDLPADFDYKKDYHNYLEEKYK